MQLERGRYHSHGPSTSFEKLKSTSGLYQSVSHKAPSLAPTPGPGQMCVCVCVGGRFASVLCFWPGRTHLLCSLPLLCSDPGADSWSGGTGGGNVGMLSVTIGQALSRGHGESPLTLEWSDWGQLRGGSFLPSLGCRVVMCPLLVWAPGDCPEGRDSRLFPPSRTKWRMLFLFKQGTVVKSPDSAHTRARQRLQ